MPIPISQLKGKANVKKAGGKKIDFAPIAKRIIASGDYYTVKEVHEGKNLVNNVVSRFRTMKLLNKQVEGRRMMRVLVKDAKTKRQLFVYGKFDEAYVKANK